MCLPSVVVAALVMATTAMAVVAAGLHGETTSL